MKHYTVTKVTEQITFLREWSDIKERNKHFTF